MSSTTSYYLPYLQTLRKYVDMPTVLASGAWPNFVAKVSEDAGCESDKVEEESDCVIDSIKKEKDTAYWTGLLSHPAVWTAFTAVHSVAIKEAEKQKQEEQKQSSSGRNVLFYWSA